MGNKNGKVIIILVVIAAAVFGITFAIISLSENVGKNQSDITYEQAISKMESLYKKVKINDLEPIKESVDLDVIDVKDSLPEINKYPAQLENTTSDFIEIFSSTEKATISEDGGDNDRWLIDVANDFNKAGITVNGVQVSVRIRGIASGLGMDYISSGKYVPDVFSPSNQLWGDTLKARGTDITLVEDRLAGNVAGIVLSKTKYDEIVGKYGSVSIGTITEAVANNELAMGYTNPLASSTGANFLMSTLYSFQSSNPLSDDAVSAFETFQTNIPFVSYTTLQMKEAAKTGSLDGFVFEYQQFLNSPDLKTGYVFTPFGVRHDNPVYELGQLSDLKKEILKEFIAYCKNDESQKKATDYGFNGYDNYKPEIDKITGTMLQQAQRLWKEKKSGNKEIISVFVADISGSMEGEPLNKLKESLLRGSKYIGDDCSVGLVTFSNDVNIALPIGKFDLNQRSLFAGAVKNMSAGGSTAMFDAIVVAQKMLMDASTDNPNAKLMLFVLSDGETNKGSNLNDTRKMIEGLKVPIYTIGYNANIEALKTISEINEAASINADIDDVVYKIENLFNAEM